MNKNHILGILGALIIMSAGFSPLVQAGKQLDEHMTNSQFGALNSLYPDSYHSGDHDKLSTATILLDMSGDIAGQKMALTFLGTAVGGVYDHTVDNADAIDELGGRMDEFESIDWTGEAGADGNDGEQGIQGETGSQGVRGLVGANGVAGLNGSDGSNGANGNDGSDGAAGSNGVDGEVCSQGVAGNNGADGGRGATGSPGSTGPPGCVRVNGVGGGTWV